MKGLEIIDHGTPLVTARSVSCSPSWLDLLFGRIGFFYLYMDHPVIFEPKTAAPREPAQDTICSYLPKERISLYAFSLQDATVPRQLLPEKVRSAIGDAQTVCCSAKGKFFFKPRNKSLSTKIEIVFHDQLEDLPTATINLSCKRRSVKLSVQSRLPLATTTSLSSYLPIDDPDVELKLQSSHPLILKQIWGEHAGSNAEHLPLVDGSFHVEAKPLDELKAHIPELYKLTCLGTMQITDTREIRFATTAIQAHTMIPASTDNQDQKLETLALEQNSFITPLLPYMIPLKGNLEGKVYEKNNIWVAELQSKYLECKGYKISDLASTVAWEKTDQHLLRGVYELHADCLAGKSTQKEHLFCTTKWITDTKTQASLDALKFSFGKTSLHGALNLFFHPFVIYGNLDAESENISPFAEFFNIPLEGSLKASFCFNPKDKVPDFETKQLFHHELELKNVRGKYFGFQHLKLGIDGHGLLPQSIMHIQAEGHSGYMQHLEIERALCACDIDLKKKNTPVLCIVSAIGKCDCGAFGIDCTAHMECTKDHLLCSLTNGSAFLDTGRVRLKEKALLKIPLHTTGFDLTPTTLVWKNGAQLILEGKNDAQGLSSSFCAQNVPLNFLHLVSPFIPLSGNVSGQGIIFGTPQNPKMQAELSSDSIFFSNQRNEQVLPVSGYVQANFDGNNLALEGQMQGLGDRRPLELRAKIPLQIQCIKAPWIAFNKGEQMTGSLSGDADIAPFLAPFLYEDEHVEGLASLDLKLLGTPEHPELSGSFSLDQGTLDMLKTGAMLTQIVLHGHIEKNMLIIDSLKAKDEERGTVFSHGNIELSIDKHFPFEFKLLLHNMELIKNDMAHVSATGTACFSGNTKKATISGNIEANRAFLNVTSDFSTELPPIDIMFVNHPEQPDGIKPEYFTLLLDIDAAIPGTGHIAGRGLDSFWKGKLRISGTTDLPTVHGTIHCSKGTFTLGSKEFNLNHGTIECSGDIYSQSRLSLIAQSDIRNIAVQILLRGSLENPSITLKSNPHMAQKEVLSWILFQKSLADISPLEGLQIAQIFFTMNRNASRYDVISRFKNALGIDHFDIVKAPTTHADTPSNLILEVGKYLSEYFFVKLSKDVANSSTKVGMQAHLHKHISLQAEVDDDAEGDVRLMWKYDY
jgi:hypothetical protein